MQNKPIQSVVTVGYALGHGCSCQQCAARFVDLLIQRGFLVGPAAGVFPNATCFRVGETIEWNLVLNPRRKWRPRVVAPAVVRKLFLELHHEVADVEDCLWNNLWDKDRTPDVRARLVPHSAKM
jgi:hypothetical protein